MRPATLVRVANFRVCARLVSKPALSHAQVRRVSPGDEELKGGKLDTKKTAGYRFGDTFSKRLFISRIQTAVCGNRNGRETLRRPIDQKACAFRATAFTCVNLFAAILAL
jgi:hypothetical protein